MFQKEPRPVPDKCRNYAGTTERKLKFHYNMAHTIKFIINFVRCKKSPRLLGENIGFPV